MSLSQGAIEGIKKGDIANEPVTLKVTNLEALGTGNKRYKCRISDGSSSMEAVLGSEAAKLAAEGSLQEGGVLSAQDYVLNIINSVQKLFITCCSVLESGQALVAVKTEDAGAAVKAEEAPAVKPEPGSATPAAASGSGLTARAQQPPTTPASQLKSNGSMMASPFVNRSARKACQPICALNPYSNDWTIRAKVASKGPLRHYDKNGQTHSVGSLDVVDDQGTTIEITLWRGIADKFYDHIEEGQVYYFRRGAVKLSQGKFKSARNDYVISMDTGSDIEQAVDQDSGKMQARLKYIAIEQLVHYAGKKVLVDVLGVVTSVGTMRSIKRKNDGTEFFCRDITVADAGGHTVGLTLWGESAEVQGAELEQSEDAIISISNCRVGEFNGVSLSSGARSALAINPESAQAEALRSWWDAEGRTAALTPLSNEQRQSGGRGPQERLTLAQLIVPKEDLPPADAKPQWHTLTATVAQIDPNQSMYYEACPDNSRKVTKQEEGWYCEYDSKVYPAMVRRYVMLAKCTDATAELSISIFNEQAEQVLGMTADELAALKEGSGVEAYEAVLKRAQWKEWQMRVQSKSQLYQDQLRQRVSVNSLKPLNFTDESRHLIAQIEKLTTSA
ncbi:hypothetical protein CVIRNUC_009926 [Coccomyxa viridis]|uniref:Replication protein A subunit n=1 Tax=Coccomyxa viridis TaxID=1274662 RepID=A0AAV1IJ54_9CHLO|nr:hypothetical protein CVIRNUC_009926 [Coccomyxa viridis]